MPSSRGWRPEDWLRPGLWESPPAGAVPPEAADRLLRREKGSQPSTVRSRSAAEETVPTGSWRGARNWSSAGYRACHLIVGGQDSRARLQAVLAGGNDFLARPQSILQDGLTVLEELKTYRPYLDGRVRL